MQMQNLLENKLLLGAGLAILGFALVLFAPKPVNTVGLIMFLIGLGVTVYGAYETFVLNKQTAEVTAAVPAA